MSVGPARRSLAADRGGAVMVMGVFMAVLMVGFIYYVKGLGDAILFRQRMQDAADAGAFAAATVHARGMNLLALINVTMASVLAVVTAFRMISELAIVGAFVSGLSAPADVPPLRALGGEAAELMQVARPMFSILRAANTAAKAVADAIPAAAEARAIDAATVAYRPPVELAFAYPDFPRLPISDGTHDELTARVGPAAAPLIRPRFTRYAAALAEVDRYGAAGLVQMAIEDARALLAAIESPSALAGMVPMRMIDGVAPGGDRLQLRVVVGGALPPSAASEPGVAIATWGRSEAAADEERALRSIGRVGLAQAEYYFDGPDGPAEWLWQQRWRARLTRLRLGAPGGYPCSQPSAVCDALDELFRRGLQRAAVH